MRPSPRRHNVLATLLALGVTACGEDKDPLDSAGTASATASATATTPGTMSAPGTDSMSGTGGSTGGTGEPTGGTDSGTATGSPTGDPATSDPATSDPTAGPPGSFCVEHCQGDGDCLVDGQDAGYTCVRGVCTSDVASGCADDFDCRILLSGWQTPCASQAECPNQFCIDIGDGEGRCAYGPNDFIDCATLQQTEILMPPIEGGPDITVCANVDWRCIDDYCQNPCEVDADCVNFPGLPHCNPGTGRCECSSDAECAGTGFSACKTAFCGCGSDAECVTANTDSCFDGLCGCSSAAACTIQVFDGTQFACEPF